MYTIFKKLLYIKILLLVFLLFGIDYTKATDVGGTISANTTWNLAGSPYVVTSSIVVNAGVTLTIDAGVEVKVNNNLYLDIQGVLNAQGTSGSKIIFTSNDPSPAPGKWRYIKLNGVGNNGSILDYIELRYAGGSLSRGIDVTSSTAIIRNSLIENNTGVGIYLSSTTSNYATIENNIIRNNSTYGIQNTNGNHTITGNTVENNGSTGLYINGGTPNVSGNTIQNNSGYGLFLPNLELRLQPNDIVANNTLTLNTSGNYITNLFDISSTVGTVDGSINEIRILNETSGLSSGDTLTLAPGSVVKTSNYRKLLINGVLLAEGTLANKIIFTSINDHSVGGTDIGTGTPAAGIWEHLTFNSSGANGSIFDYVEVRYAGQYSKALDVYRSSVTIRNSLIENNTGVGIYLNSTTTDLATVENNIIRNNSTYGIQSVNGNHTITGNTIENNGSTGLYINGYTPNVSGNTIQNNGAYGLFLPNLELRLQPNDVLDNNTLTGNTSGNYITNLFDISSTAGTVDGSVNEIRILNETSGLSSGDTLTLTPGSVVKTSNWRALDIQGTLLAEGAVDNKIIFTSINDHSVGGIDIGTGTPAAGNWENLRFYNSGSNGSILDYVEIRYSGQNSKGLRLYNSSATVKNSLIENNTGVGIYLQSLTSDYATVENNIIRNNSTDGIFIANGNHTLTNNIVENNTSDGIYINGGLPSLNGNTVQNNGAYGLFLPNLELRLQPNDVVANNTLTGNTGGNYISNYFDISSASGTINASVNEIRISNELAGNLLGDTLTLTPGSIVKMGNGRYIDIQGTLLAEGTVDNKIIFTSINDHSVGGTDIGTGTPAAGNWEYLKINGAGSNSSILDYVELRYSGGSTRGGLYLYRTAAIIRNSLIENNDSYGIYLDSTTTDYSTIENSVIKNNASIGIYNTNGSHTITDNTIENNSSSGIKINAGFPIVTGNIIQNNTGYGLNYYNLEFRLQGNDIVTNNTLTGNTSGNYISDAFDISSVSGTIDASVNEIRVLTDTNFLDSGKTLTLIPGSIVKVSNSRYIQIAGVLNAEGTLDNKIIFTSINDHSVGGTDIGTGTPSAGNWDMIKFAASGANGSILDNTEVRYAGAGYNKGIWIYRAQVTVQNSLIENNNGAGIYLESGTGDDATIKNNIIRNNGTNGILFVAGAHLVNNNNILNNGTDGIYINNSGANPIIKNNIFMGNVTGVKYNAGTPVVTNNLFYNNTTAPTSNYTLDGSNITGQDPLFVTGTYELQSGSPAIGTGDAVYAQDIGAYGYTGFLTLNYGVNITGVSGRNLTYEWSFISDPTGGVTPPTIVGSTGNINDDGDISCMFQVQKLGDYQIKLVIKEGGVEIGSGVNGFTITN